MNIANSITCTALVVLLAGCGSDSSSSNRNPHKRPAPKPTVSYRDMSDDYNKLLCKADACSPGSPQYYHFLANDGFVSLAADPSSSMSMNLFLLANHAYVAELQKLKPMPNVDSSMQQVVEKQKVVGNWSVSASGIFNLENLGVGQYMTYNGYAALDFKVMRSNQVDPVFDQTEMYLTSARSSAVPVEIEQNCN